MKNRKALMWKNYRALRLGVLLAFLCDSPILAASNSLDAIHSGSTFEDAENSTEAKLSQTIVYALPEKPIIVERNNMGEKYRRGVSVSKVLFGKAKIDWRPAYLPIRRMLSELTNGNVNFAFYVKNEFTESCCITSDKPAFFMELGIFRAIDSPPFTQLTDLRNRKVIVIDEYQYGIVGEFIHDKNNNITIYSAADNMTALSMLVAGRADYLLDYRAATTDIYKAVKKHNIAYTVLRKIELYMLLNRGYPNARGVMKRLETIYHNIPKDILNNPCVECIAGVREEADKSRSAQ